MEDRPFPSSRAEALAWLYIQNQDLTGKTPEEIDELYWSAFRVFQGEPTEDDVPQW